MKMMQRMISLLVCIALALSLAACGDKQEGTPNSSSSTVRGELEYTYDDIAGLVSGVEDVYVYQGAVYVISTEVTVETEDASGGDNQAETTVEELILNNVRYEEAIIHGVAVDTTKVDESVCAAYQITYDVTAGKESLDAYLAGTMVLDDEATYVQSDSEVHIIVERTATIVAYADVASLVDEGVLVLGLDTNAYASAVATVGTSNGDANTPEAVDSTSESDPSESQGQESDPSENDSDTGNAGNSGSTGADNNSGNSDSDNKAGSTGGTGNSGSGTGSTGSGNGTGKTGSTGNSGSTGTGNSGNSGTGSTGNNSGSTGTGSGSGTGGSGTGKTGSTGNSGSGSGSTGNNSGSTGSTGGTGNSGSGTGSTGNNSGSTGSTGNSGNSGSTGTGTGSGSGSGSNSGSTGGTGNSGSGSGSTGSNSGSTGNGTGSGTGKTGSTGNSGSGTGSTGNNSGSTGTGTGSGSGSNSGSTGTGSDSNSGSGSNSGSTGSNSGSTGTGTVAHTHSYTSKVTKAATCATDGVRTYTCSCGDTYTEVIPATGKHTWVEQTKEVWVEDDPVWVVDEEEHDEEEFVRYDKYYFCNNCREARFENSHDAADHLFECTGTYGGGYSLVKEPIYKTVHYDEVGHYEEKGHYETVVTGYVCSECGATKKP